MRFDLSEYAAQVLKMDPQKTYSVIQAKTFIAENIPLLANDIDAHRHVLETCIYTSIHHDWPRHIRKPNEAPCQETAEGVDLEYNPQKAHPAWLGERWIRALSTPVTMAPRRILQSQAVT